MATYGYTNIRPDEEPRHRTVKQVAAARVKFSALDRELSQRISEERKNQKLNRQIDALLRKEQQ